MRIAELSRATDVPIPTIKYYLRERLLFPGEFTAPNQADYNDAHVRRVRLIRVLIEIGRLGIAQVRPIVAAIDDQSLSRHEMLGVVQKALGPDADRAPRADVVAARDDVDRWLERRGWRVSEDAPGRWSLAHTLAALRRLGRDVEADVFDRNASMIEELAGREVTTIPLEASRAEAVERMVVGTVVFETALVALRRLAHEHHSASRFVTK
jgi:DNA-binding transcriptional MerR regulator